MKVGADYLWACVEVPDEFVTIDHDRPSTTIDSSGFARYLFDRLASLDLGVRVHLACEHLGADEDDPVEEIDLMWSDAITIVVSGLAGERRDTTWTRFGETVIVHSGGPSWGDYPTDSFCPLIAVDALLWAVMP